MTAAAEATGPRAVPAGATPTDFTVLLPPGWVRIPLGDDTDARVVALATERSRPFPPGHRDTIRTMLTRTLARAVAEGRRAGGIDILLSVDSIEGVAVPASCLVSYLAKGDGEGEGAPPTEVVLAQLAEPGADLSVRETGVGTAVRRQLTRLLPASALEPGAEPGTFTEVAWYVRVPGRSGLLAFTFSTPAEEFAPALVTLFDAMAVSLRWVTR